MDRKPRGFLYKVQDSIILVRNRPLSMEDDFSGPLAEEDQADAYLSVTDTFVIAPPGRVFTWVPWNEGRVITPEQLYACCRTLLWWTHYQKLKRVQVFCDGGTHRSVTVFGAFLLAYFTRTQAEAIIAAREPVNTHHREDWSNPLEYIDSYLVQYPEDLALLQEMGRNRLGRLEALAKTVVDRVRERLGLNQGSMS